MLYLKIKRTMMGVGFIAVSILLLTVGNTVWAGCPASTVADMKGVKPVNIHSSTNLQSSRNWRAAK